MVSIGHKYAVNFTYTNDFDFPYVSFGINLDAPPDRPSIQKALAKCLPGVPVGRTICVNTRPPATDCRSPFGRSTSKRIAIKECSHAKLLDDPVVGLVTMSEGVDRQTSELLA